MSLGNVGAGSVEWTWYSPDGNQFYTGSVDIPMPTSGAYWSSYNIWYYINVAGSNAVNMPGNWHVDIYLDGSKILTEHFSIQGSQPITASDWFDKGQELYFQGKYDDALQAFDEAIKIDPENAAAWQNKGETLDAQHKYDEAVAAFDKATDLDPQNANTWNRRG